MEGRREGVATSPSLFSSAVSLSREVGSLTQIGRLPGVSYGAIATPTMYSYQSGLSPCSV